MYIPLDINKRLNIRDAHNWSCLRKTKSFSFYQNLIRNVNAISFQNFNSISFSFIVFEILLQYLRYLFEINWVIILLLFLIMKSEQFLKKLENIYETSCNFHKTIENNLVFKI